MKLQRALVNTSLYTVVSLLQKAAGVLLLPIYTRYMTPDDYGTVTTVTAMASICAVFMGLGLRRAAGRFYFDAPDDADYLGRVWGTILTVSLAAVVGVGGTFVFGARWLLLPWVGDIPFYPFVLLGIVIAVAQPFTSIYSEIVRMREQGQKFALFQGVLFVLKTGLGVLLVVVFDLKALGVLAAYALTGMAGMVLAIGLLREHVTWGIDRGVLSELLAYSLPVLPHAVLGTLMASVDRIFLNELASTAAAGLFGVAISLAAVLRLITNSANHAVRPVAFRLFDDFDATKGASVQKIGVLVLIGYAVVATWLGLGAHELLMVLVGEDFEGAWVVVPILVFGYLLHGVYYLFSLNIHYKKSASRLLIVLSFTGLTITVLANLMLTPFMGLYGAAIASMAASLGYVVVGLYLSSRVHPMRWPIGSFLLVVTIAAAGLAAGYGVEYLESSIGVNLILKAVVGLVITGCLGAYAYRTYRQLPRSIHEVHPG